MAETQIAARDEVRALYPWAETLGLGDLVSDLILDDASANQIVAEVRNTNQYKRTFPGMVGPDGRRRFGSERQYLDQVESYRDVLMAAGWYDPATDSPQDYAAFMDSGIDPNELRDRATIYKTLEAGTSELRDAFYVYAGMDVSVDDLFQAVVAPEFGQQLAAEYNREISSTGLDYETFITRATERNLEKVADTLTELEANGVVASGVAAKVRSVDPEFAREMMGAIANTGDRTLALDELSWSFQYAMLGSAATEAGLALPDKDTVEALRVAGVSRAQAARSYNRFSTQGEGLQGMVRRTGTSTGIDQKTYAMADMLETGSGVDLIARAEALENALGRTAGSYGTAREGDRLTQRSRRGLFQTY